MKSLMLIIMIMALATGGAFLAQAQDQPSPQREDNRWGDMAHQPDESQVFQAEQAQGVAPSQQQQKALTNDVQQLYQNLMSGPGGGSQSQSSGQ